MLDDAVGAFLDSVTERGFDQPFLALLRASGFEEVAWVHGPQEFGKDFVAKKDGEQWTFQSKAGDINQSDWRQLVGQRLGNSSSWGRIRRRRGRNRTNGTVGQVHCFL